MEELDEKLDVVKVQLAAAQHSAVGTQTQLAHAHEAAVASGRTMLDLQTELAAVNVVNDDIKSQLVKALAAKAALSGSVMHVCAQRETQNPYFSTVTCHLLPLLWSIFFWRSAYCTQGRSAILPIERS